MNKSEKIDKAFSSNNMDSPRENATKTKPKNRGKKRKRRASGSSSEYEEMLSENALQMEKNLHASAVKNNLDETSVRKILKKVVTNDHVLALVKLREEEEDSGPEENSLRPKLTRAKVKELMKVSPKAAPWNLENLELTPIKHIPVKTRPEVKALIAQELPDDEDDEEYEPTHEDVPSDDDQGLESCSDLDSQPRTPATPRTLHTSSPRVVKDGPFKVPQDVSTPTRRKLDLEEEATIALRTRSKLSLSATSIEHIESTFVPPDEAPQPVVDDLWSQFLSECLGPAPSAKHEDDDETDPEYNVAADPDAQDEDEEALGNSIIKISKKELNDLVTELFNIMPAADEELALAADKLANSVLTDHSQSEISTRWEGKQEPLSDEEGRRSFSDRITFEKRGYSRPSGGKTEPTDEPEEPEDDARSERSKGGPAAQAQKTAQAVNIDMIEEEEEEATEEEGEPDGRKRLPPPPLQRHLKLARARGAERVTINVNDNVNILSEQIAILQQQLRQHIQLATSTYLQLFTHPVHWSLARYYKDYLEAFSKMCESNPASVVNVCNLQPALELMRSWETAVSLNTPENNEMVEFIHKDLEKCRKRYSNKYVGDFHDTLKQVVANSPVFLYPTLLPPLPFRADRAKRTTYTRSEDELIALGLDQFWDYVEANPALFKPRPAATSGRRWGLTVTLELVAKYMFPWMPFRTLLGHVQFVRKSQDKDNPINKFFEKRTVTRVKHKLLPFNPRLTLYEQPEHEVPKIWVRYLAKTSKRFRKHLYHRSYVKNVAPQGVEVNLGEQVLEPTKKPLPIDFTQEIVSNRINVLPKVPKPSLADKFDIQIATPPTTAPSLSTSISLFRLVETSTGAYLMPLSNGTTTVDTNTTPISTPAELTTQPPETSSRVEEPPINIEIPTGNEQHCSCCIMLRKIYRTRQTTITEYFSRNKSQKKCYCDKIKFPKITNRLRILVSNFKSNSVNALQCIEAKLKGKYSEQDEEIDSMEKDFNMDDFVFVSCFHLKLLSMCGAARDSRLKRRVHSALARFEPRAGSALHLARCLDKACATELVDLYKEFLCFLTPEQADICDGFRDYFVRNCVQDLVKKIEVEVSNPRVRRELLGKLRDVSRSSLYSACGICSWLLASLREYPELAKHVFYLFPHRKETRCGSKPPSLTPRAPCTPPPRAAPHDPDHSSSEEEAETNGDVSATEDTCQPAVIKNELSIVANETQALDSAAPTVTHTHTPTGNTSPRHDSSDSSDSSNHSMTIVCDEHDVKCETPEWKRDEDKLILELLKEHLTPEERKDKTILEMIEEKNIINMLAENLTDKSKSDVTSRVLYLLQMLVLSEKQ